MPNYLFIGGPAHGEFKDIKLKHDIIYVPKKINVTWVEPGHIPPIGPNIEAAVYRKRALYLSHGEYAEVMAEECLSQEEVWKRLGDYLAQKWVSEQFKLEVQHKYMTAMNMNINVEEFMKELKTYKPKYASLLGSDFVQKSTNSTNEAIAKLKEFIPDLNKIFEPPIICPACDSQDYYLQHVTAAIMHLNDSHRWSFEKIADFVDSLPADYVVKE